jgi:hypothetical protein
VTTPTAHPLSPNSNTKLKYAAALRCVSLTSSQGGATRNVPLLALCAASAGGLGAFVGTPAEVALIRMSADGKLPPSQRRNYTWVGNALTRVVREEGILTLWRGCGPTIGRAVVLNIAQLMSNDLAKDALCRQDVVQRLKEKNTFLQVLVAG